VKKALIAKAAVIVLLLALEAVVFFALDIRALPYRLAAAVCLAAAAAAALMVLSKKGKGAAETADAKTILILTAAAVFFVVAAAGALTWNTVQVNKEYQLKLEMGDRLLAEGDYEEALLCYEAALDLKPRGEEAALGLAEAHIHLGDYNEAISILDGLAPGSQALGDRLALLTAAAGLKMRLVSVDTANFPEVKLEISYKGSDPGFLAEDFSVSEDGASCRTEGIDAEENRLILSYMTEPPENGTEERSISALYDYKGLTLEADAEYVTPVLAAAEMTLVTMDMSDYPSVRAYYRVEDPATGESVDGLTALSFTLQEKVEGGEFLAREIRSVEQLEGNAGLNVCLAADKSDSILYSDLAEIKNVLYDFTSDLEYSIGDMAELLAFDTDVTQMCLFTNDVNLLKNGISNMYTSGRTALYDALKVAVNHVRLENGAGCVIAFTDGLDNESLSGAWDVIGYAQKYSVPIYIIGVGPDVDEHTLQEIAEQTGGKYWFISDLSELSDVYTAIYREQKEMYVIEYESDVSADAYTPRTLDVSFAGAGYKGNCDAAFTPRQIAADDGGVALQPSAASSSRYELFMSNMSWEDASEYCAAQGGHLVTISSQDEEELVESMAEDAGASYVWLGGYTSYDGNGNMFGHWVTGEDFGYTKWCEGEPSKDDLDGAEERYIVLWYLERFGGWSWNDTRNDPVSIGSYTDELAFVCEFEN
jgi:Mg-chelatase subunit ChlD